MHKIKDRKRKQSTPDKREIFKQKEAKPRPSEEEGKNELIFVILQKKKKKEPYITGTPFLPGFCPILLNRCSGRNRS